MVDENNEVVETPESNDEKLSPEFREALDKAAETVIDEFAFSEDKAAPEEKKASEPDDDPDEDTETEADEPETDDAQAVSEEVIERAVRAGMTLKDANAIKDADALIRIVEVMEKSKEASKTEEGDASEAESEEEDLLAKIPDLNPEEYEEGVVNMFKNMKEVLAAQQKAIKDQNVLIADLRKSVSPEEDFVGKKIAALDKEFSHIFPKGDTKNKAKLDSYVKALAGVEKELSPDEVFEKALHAAFDKEISQAKSKKLAAVAKKRSAQAIERPRSLTGKFTSDSIGPVTEDEATYNAVKELEEKFAVS